MKIKRLVAETWPALNRRIKMNVSERFMIMVGLFIVVSTFMLSSAAMAAERTKSPAPAGGAMSQSYIKFTEISVDFQKADVVIAYQSPASIRLICKFSDQGPVKTSHSVSFYINNNKVFDIANAPSTVVKDVDMPAIGTYTFKCVVDGNNANSISLPFKIAKFFYETCRPIVTVHMVPDSHTLTTDLGLSIPLVMDANNPPYSLNVPNAPDQILSLTGSTIVPPGNEVKCIYGSALFYKKECKQAKKVINQHKYECSP
jgi:hypothetical protein